MTTTGINIVTNRIKAKILILESETSYNRRRIFLRAKYIMNSTGKTWSESLKQSWYESKSVILNKRSELESLKNDLLNFLTPKVYEETEEYNNILSHKAVNKAYELNQLGRLD